MTVRSIPLRGLLVWVALLGLCLAGSSSAQETDPAEGDYIDEIVVLGTESESAEDFASGDSVTGFGAEDLAALGAQSIADLASFTPNLEIVTAGATTPTFFIRGVGLNDFNPTATGAVAVYQDDVAINAPAIQLGTLYDVEGVNVLRGPQGTGLARNASAGAIKIYGKKPVGRFGGYLRTDFGNYGYQDYEGAVESPMFEDILAGRLAFRLTKRDGTMSNGCGSALKDPRFDSGGGRFRVLSMPNQAADPPTSLTQGPWSQCGEPVDAFSFSDVPFGLEDDVNDTNNWAARGTLLFQPTLDTTFYINAHGSQRDELTRLGQSIGTRQSWCTDPTVVCTSPRPPPPGVIDRSVAKVSLLGGTQAPGARNPNNGYIPQEIRRRFSKLAPCVVSINPLDQCALQDFETRLASNRARLKVARELADDLDSDPWRGDFNRVGDTTNDTWGGYLNGLIALPRGMELSSVTAVDAYDRSVDTDLDFSPETLFHVVTADDAWQVYQDLSLRGYLGESDFGWEIGAWYLHEELNADVDLDFGDTVAGVTARDYEQILDSFAAYAGFEFDFWEDFTLDGGYRWNWEEKSLDMLIVGGSTEPESCTRSDFGAPLDCQLQETWHASTGTIRLLYRFREDTHVSWRYTRGWKPGGFNATASAFTGPSVADPETLNSFELGLHGSWFESRVRLDASLFYYNYDNYQIFTARQFLGGAPEFVLLNVNDAEVYGSEIDVILRPWIGAFVNVRFSWLESQFLDFVRRDQLPNPGSGQGQSLPFQFREFQASGNQLLNSPRFKVSLTAEQTFPLGAYGSFTMRYDGVWTDTTFYDASEGRGIGDEEGFLFLPENTVGQKPYWLHNLRGTWRAPSGSFELSGWVRNLLDTSYKSFAFDASNFQNTTIYFVGDPRTYGVSMTVTF